MLPWIYHEVDVEEEDDMEHEVGGTEDDEGTAVRRHS